MMVVLLAVATLALYLAILNAAFFDSGPLSDDPAWLRWLRR